MARVDVIMPQMGESIAEGTVSRWLKKVGDEVKRDEPILEISTDKVDAEIPAPAEGVLAEIKVEEGQTVEVQTVVAVIETEKGAAVAGAAGGTQAPGMGEAAAAQPEEPRKRDAEREKKEKERETREQERVPQREERPAAQRPPAPAGPATQTAPVADGDGRGADETAEQRLRRRSTPLVRKIAAEHRVDISRIEGSGHAGRVTKKDIVAYLESGEKEAPAVTPAAPGRARGPSVGEGVGVVEHPTVEPWPGDRVEPMSRIRKLTADHMVLSQRISAHVTSYYEVDFSTVAKHREAKKREYEERGAKLTFLTFIVKAIADQLRRHPILNASVSGDHVIYRSPINIGIAVALDWGLIVPVIKDADELSLLGISKQMADLAERARTKRLRPDEVQQGTFTITNPGVFGSYVGAPIINQPQVAILGVGAIEKRPKVITLDDGQDVIAVRTMGMLSLSYDHRIVDGADADRFMSDVKRDLEDFPAGAV